MGRYVTPRGVVVEVSDEAARVVGYKPAEDAQAEKPKKSSAKKSTSSKSSK